MSNNNRSGEPLHGFLAEGTSAAAGLAVPMYRQNAGRYFVGPAMQLELVLFSITLTVGGDGYLFADYEHQADIATATAGSTDEFTITGDVSHILPVDATFYVLDSTGNDGQYTVTSVSYDLSTDTTTIGVAAVADGTDDGTINWLQWAITDADATANTLQVAGDQTAYFKAGRLFRVNGSTGNDNSDSDYTTVSATYDQDTDRTTISVASVADGTDDGFVVLQTTDFASNRYIAGDYAANGGRERNLSERWPLAPGYTLFADAPAGNIDAETMAFLKRNL